MVQTAAAAAGLKDPDRVSAEVPGRVGAQKPSPGNAGGEYTGAYAPEEIGGTDSPAVVAVARTKMQRAPVGEPPAAAAAGMHGRAAAPDPYRHAPQARSVF